MNLLVFMYELTKTLNSLDTEKAQIVETELISNHREEISQLRKLIAQKEEDLHRMVEKYEQVIQVL